MSICISHTQVFTSDHALKLEWVPNWIAIIGSGYIGLEFSDVYTALGSEVTFIEVRRSKSNVLAPNWSTTVMDLHVMDPYVPNIPVLAPLIALPHLALTRPQLRFNSGSMYFLTNPKSHPIALRWEQIRLSGRLCHFCKG